jgi:hypothetical protein
MREIRNKKQYHPLKTSLNETAKTTYYYNTFTGFYFLKLLINSTHSHKIKPQLYNAAIQRSVPVALVGQTAERSGCPCPDEYRDGHFFFQEKKWQRIFCADPLWMKNVSQQECNRSG